MTEDLWIRWMFLGLIFLNGIVLGRRLFGPKVPKEGRWSGAVIPLAMTLLIAPMVIESSSAVRWGALWIAVALLLLNGVQLMVTTLRPKVSA